jgi:CRISPR type I-E-associated protein CasB/Cse2
MSNEDRFIRYLYSLNHEDTGTLAALRRACGKRLAESRNCQDFESVSTRAVDFLTATLAAQYSSAQIKAGTHHARYDHRGSIGAAWARYCRERDRDQDPATFYRNRQEALARGQEAPRPPSIHERFRTLLDAQLEIDGTGELAYRLRGLVRMCVAAEVPIDVIQLAHDLRGWRAESRYVQERWARAFYGQPREAANDQMQPLDSDSEQEKGQIGEDKENETNAD